MFKRPFAAAMVLVFVSATAADKLPQRNMTVELRIVTEADATRRLAPVGTAADEGSVLRSSPSQESAPEVQKIYAMNGERAHMKWGVSMPVQWVKTAVSHTTSTTSSAPGASPGDVATGAGSGVENALIWMDAGREISVLVRWPGGKQSALVELELQSNTLEERAGQNLPGQSRGHLSTTAVAPLGEWVTVAITGRRPPAAQTGVYSTASVEADPAKLVQVRILAP